MNIESLFTREFKQTPKSFYWSPGRVNIIGEHSDYHDGFVMPAAIDLGITWAARKRTDDKIRVYSDKFDEIGEFSVSDKKRTKYEWLLYIQGVIESLKKRKIKVGGVEIAFHSTIPIGSGLSSSSSIATGFAYIVNDLFNLGFDRKEIAQIGCEAEWWYGTTGGIMDQYCIANGKRGHAVLLDCRKLAHELIEIPKNIEIVIFETTIRHKQINSPFDLRKRQASEVIEIAKKVYPDKDIRKLRDLNEKMLSGIRSGIIKKFGKKEGDMYFRRALHPVTENERVKRMKNALPKGDFRMIGLILSQSHQSLRNNYEVSCKELDAAVEISHSFGELVGSRMIGGGFGGCTINLVKKGRAKHFAGLLEEKFRRITGIKGNSYICGTSDGVKKIT